MATKKTPPVVEDVDWNKLPAIFFEPKSGMFFFKLPDRFLRLTDRQVKLQLMLEGLRTGIEDPETGLKLGDRILATAAKERWVDYAGPLSGYKVGRYELPSGKRLLVTTEAHPVQPKAGKLDWFDKYLSELLGDEQMEQALLWLKFAYESLLKGDFRPGQFLVLAGESGCGKSLFQEIVTRLFGGRGANPWRYMSGETNFNEDLAQAEHLWIEDQASSLDLKSRRQFGEAIKQITVVEWWSVHGKGKEALTLRFFKRGTMTVNNQPEKMSTLPPIDNDLKDKITLLNCSKAELSPDREENIRNVERELPALAHLLKTMRCPKKFQDDRYGVKAYHNAELLDMLSGLAPETKLLDLIDQVFFGDKVSPVIHLTASEIEAQLVENPKLSYQVQKLLHFPSACGTFLSRLRQKYPQRIEQTTIHGKTRWKISSPE